MAVPAEPNAEALANLIQDQGQGQPLVQDQQIQAQEQQPQAQAQQPQAPPGAAAAQVQVGEVFRLCSLLFSQLCAVFLGVSSLARDLASVIFMFYFRSHYRALSLHVYRVLCQVLPFMCHPFTVVAPLAYFVTVCLPDKKLGHVIDLRKSLVVCST